MSKILNESNNEPLERMYKLMVQDGFDEYRKNVILLKKLEDKLKETEDKVFGRGSVIKSFIREVAFVTYGIFEIDCVNKIARLNQKIELNPPTVKFKVRTNGVVMQEKLETISLDNTYIINVLRYLYANNPNEINKFITLIFDNIDLLWVLEVDDELPKLDEIKDWYINALRLNKVSFIKNNIPSKKSEFVNTFYNLTDQKRRGYSFNGFKNIIDFVTTKTKEINDIFNNTLGFRETQKQAEELKKQIEEFEKKSNI